jgi:hypothetical protein
VANGEPGLIDSRKASGTGLQDDDKDGLTALVEAAAGMSDANPHDYRPGAVGLLTIGADKFRTLSFRRDQRTDRVAVSCERSSNLTAWDESQTEEVSVSDHGDGTETVVWRSVVPYNAAQREYLRVNVEVTP